MNRRQRRAGKKQSLAPAKTDGRYAMRGVSPLVQDVFADALRHHQAERLDEAARLYQQVLTFDSCHAESLHLLGVIAGQVGHHDLAVGLIGQAIAVNAEMAPYHYNLGLILQRQGRLDEAVACYCRALDLEPDVPETHYNLAIAWQEQGRLDKAVACYRRALALKLDYLDAYINLGYALWEQGRLDDAVACYRRALSLTPDFTDAHNNLLMSLYYSAQHSDAEILTQARRFGRQMERSCPSLDFRNTPDPHRRLRIGYVSADFRAHPVGYFLAGVLAAHDPAKIEIFCYSNSPQADAMTTRLQEAAHQWRSIVGVADAEARALIQRDGIDILVDLSGHTGKNRLSLFAIRPAPVQVTWLGYFGTTGLSTIDYIIADRFVVPPGEEGSFTEKVWRLPECYLCYSVHPLDIPVGPFPAMTNGFVTFGCFNNLAKISAETVAAWASILRRLEGSRLFLKTKSLGDAGCRATMLAAFGDHGISGERLILEGHSPPAEALAAYHRVDIALDPFPFGGCMTTAETLWMGVPLVTQQGARWVGRMSQSILAALDLADWVAGNTDHYVETACRLAADLPHLAGLRSGLRQRLESSPFCDGPRFAESLETAYRGMWNAWCVGHAKGER